MARKDRWKIWGIILIVGLFLIGFWLLFNYAFAQDFVGTNQITVACDPVAPILPTDIIAYQWFRTPYPLVGDRQDPNAHEDLAITIPMEVTITFTIEGEYVIGVRTVRGVEGVSIPSYSDIIWSDVDDPVGSVPVPFIVRYLESAEVPVNFRYL